MPETMPISPGLISTRASEASAESILAGVGDSKARPRPGKTRRSGAAIASEPHTGERWGAKGDAAKKSFGADGLRMCDLATPRI